MPHGVDRDNFTFKLFMLAVGYISNPILIKCSPTCSLAMKPKIYTNCHGTFP